MSNLCNTVFKFVKLCWLVFGKICFRSQIVRNSRVVRMLKQPKRRMCACSYSGPSECVSVWVGKWQDVPAVVVDQLTWSVVVRIQQLRNIITTAKAGLHRSADRRISYETQWLTTPSPCKKNHRHKFRFSGYRFFRAWYFLYMNAPSKLRYMAYTSL